MGIYLSFFTYPELTPDFRGIIHDATRVCFSLLVLVLLNLPDVSVVFPGGLLPTLTLLVTSLTTASAGSLVVDSVANIGPHYARTLREWRRRFIANFDTIAQGLRKERPQVFTGEGGERELEVFRNRWLCERTMKM